MYDVCMELPSVMRRLILQFVKDAFSSCGLPKISQDLIFDFDGVWRLQIECLNAITYIHNTFKCHKLLGHVNVTNSEASQYGVWRCLLILLAVQRLMLQFLESSQSSWSLHDSTLHYIWMTPEWVISTCFEISTCFVPVYRRLRILLM